MTVEESEPDQMLDESSMFDVFTVGESMIRLSSPPGERLETADRFDVRIGGTESNVAVALARLGRKAAWASVLPDNALGRRITRELAWHGVITTGVQWTSDDRAGVYFLDSGSPPRATQVIYDRKDSAFARVSADAFDISGVERARHLHLTGITPALSAGCSALCHRLTDAARRCGATFSFDVNYRSLLWTPEQAGEGLEQFCAQADILFCGHEDAGTIWGFQGSSEKIVSNLARRFKSDITVLTLGGDGAVMQRNGELTHVDSIPVQIVDPVGAGDAFAAGFLHGYLDNDIDRALRTASALAALKMTVNGDLAVITPAELEAVVSNQQRTIIR